MLDRDESRDEAAVSFAEGVVVLAAGLVMFFFADPLHGPRDWLWLSFSGLVTALGVVLVVRTWRRLWAFRRR